MNKQILLLCCLFLCTNFMLGQKTGFSINGNLNWEGTGWSGNVPTGSWWPSYDTLANFGIDNYSWGEVRTLDTISLGDSIQVSAQILLNSGGVNGNEAFFCIGNQWVNY